MTHIVVVRVRLDKKRVNGLRDGADFFYPFGRLCDATGFNGRKIDAALPNEQPK
ncbi:MAG: hypothetical protein JWP25_5408 [Bradyrhizobium sp.]|nr:hypothetical protein [Bradyrhizobium sp.]